MSPRTQPRSETARSPVRTDLKRLKDGFDDPSLDCEEGLIELNVRRGLTPLIRENGGELIHQVALRHERRGEIREAKRLYRLAFTLLEGNPLGQARALRDEGTMTLKFIDPQEGLEQVRQAWALHDRDKVDIGGKALAKAERQRLITQSYLWRSEIITGSDNARLARRNLIKLARGADFDFCVRDRKVVVDFLVSVTKGQVHRELLAMQATILLERRKPLDFVRSCGLLVIDMNLAIAGAVVRKIF